MPLARRSTTVTDNTPHLAQRIDRLVQELCGLSRSQIKGLFDHGCVSLNGALCMHPEERLKAGDQIELTYDPNQRYHPKPKPRRNLGFEIVFEDKHLIVVNKPANLLSVPTRRQETNTLLHKVEAYVKHVGGGRGAFTVHRLDRGVSGLLVLGKSSQIVRQLKDQFAASKPEREYLALVAGYLKPKSGTFESLLATDKDLNRFSTQDENIGQLAITHYRVIAHLQDATLAQVRLETGRRNQIRVQFADTGHPVLGDPRYQTELATAHHRWQHKRLALHARLLGFAHPITHQPLRFEVELPREMEQFIRETSQEPRKTRNPQQGETEKL